MIWLESTHRVYFTFDNRMIRTAMKYEKIILKSGLRIVLAPMAEAETVTVRDRDTMQQTRVKIVDLQMFFS